MDQSVGSILSNFPNIDKDFLRMIVNEYELEFGIGIDSVDFVMRHIDDKSYREIGILTGRDLHDIRRNVRIYRTALLRNVDFGEVVIKFNRDKKISDLIC